MVREVVTASENLSLLDAATLMRKHSISGMPVTDLKGRVVGVLSEKDIVRSLNSALEIATPAGLLDFVLGLGNLRPDMKLVLLNEHLAVAKVGDAMSPDPVTIAPDSPLDTAARIMRERRINRLPVVEDGRLVGIVTRNDVIAAV
jgi:CBS domain-containing protein